MEYQSGGLQVNTSFNPSKLCIKKIIRVLSGSQNYYEHTNPLFKIVSILKVPEIFTLSLTSQIFRALKIISCETLTMIIKCNQTVKRDNLRNTNSLTKAKYILSKSRRAMSYHGVAFLVKLASQQQLHNHSHCLRFEIV